MCVKGITHCKEQKSWKLCVVPSDKQRKRPAAWGTLGIGAEPGPYCKALRGVVLKGFKVQQPDPFCLSRKRSLLVTHPCTKPPLLLLVPFKSEWTIEYHQIFEEILPQGKETEQNTLSQRT